MRRAVRGTAVLAVLGAVAAWSVPPSAGAADELAGHQSTKLSGTITVSAAASLTEAFTKMGADFRKANRGTSVTFNFAASSALVAQIRGGAPADVFAAADATTMRKLVRGGQVTAAPTPFAANALTIVVKPGNPNDVTSLADLAEVATVSLCADTVPCGKYAQRVLVRAGVTIPTDRIAQGADVKATLAAVSTGDADAAIVYATDAQAAGTAVRAVEIPTRLDVDAGYLVAPLAESTNRSLAKAWVRFTVSPAGQKTLHRFGFLPAPAR
jgi:molybdate transport system substrate-binding protein